LEDLYLINNIDKVFQVKELEQLAPKLIESINILGYRIVRVMMIEASNRTLQFMIERSDLTDINIRECVKLSKVISEILDEKDLIKEEYLLEVSSPGIERPIIEYNDYKRFKGSMVNVKLVEKYNNKKKFNAYIKDCEDNRVIFVDDKDKEIMILPLSLISNAKLIYNEF
tara:strand:+ start:1198 stop:1707 length:510 start_codon:yes stop_codon:yes gene_type:complete